MADITKVLDEVNAANTLLPNAIRLVLSLRTPKGETVLADLDAADAQNAVNIAEAEAFIDAAKDQ